MPSEYDIFNITYLVAQKGDMKATWVNLYGIEQCDYQYGMNPNHSSAFLGRILMSLHLSPSENPRLMVGTAPTSGEPKCQKAKLWIDVYDFGSITDMQILEQSKLWITCPFMGKDIRHKKLKYQKDSSKTFSPLNANFRVPDLEIEKMPRELSQVPDLFLYVCVKEDKDTFRRLGFIRFSPKDIMNHQP
jgi:hypothetical protein